MIRGNADVSLSAEVKGGITLTVVRTETEVVVVREGNGDEKDGYLRLTLAEMDVFADLLGMTGRLFARPGFSVEPPPPVVVPVYPTERDNIEYNEEDE